VGIGLLFCANAIFESTSQGLEASFIGSLTGHFAVGARGEETFGLFGSEVPIVSEYEIIPSIADFSAVASVLDVNALVARWTPLVSAAAQFDLGGYVLKVPVFGVDPVSYFALCSDIVVDRGDITALTAGGVFLNARLARDAEAALGRELVLGEPIVFSMYTNGSFRVRRGTFAGVHHYPAPTEVLDRVVLADPVIVRALCDYTMGYASVTPTDSEVVENYPEAGDLDDLFETPIDVDIESTRGLELANIEANLADTESRDKLVLTDDAAWSFALVRVEEGKSVTAARRSVERALMESQSDGRILDWRIAAGSSAIILFAVRAAFNIGVGFLILGASLIVMNALVISVLERTGEIGSMRALGASRNFVRTLFVIETMLLTLFSAVVGLSLGAFTSILLAKSGIPVSNPLLISLFGGTVLHPIVELRSFLFHLAGAALIGSLAWIYPVSLALRIQPVSAMAER